MLLLVVKGGGKRLNNEVVEYANFCLDQLVSKRMKNVLEIYIKIEKQMMGEPGSKYWGICDSLDIEFRPRQFVIQACKRGCLKTIGHELVHVKQMAKGELIDYINQPDYTRWKRRKYYIPDGTYKHKSPWELEARKYEDIFIKKWREMKKAS